MSLDLQAGALQQPGHREHRADAHLVGLAAGDREAAEDAERLQVALLRRSFASITTQAPRAVGELAGVAGGDHAAGHRRLRILLTPS